ncbi:alpha/beta hydrolase [Solibacillus daqui]|uniref:alpha/beta hydrolase n=1 Tax=Solibacillus daqui TaxID=2912187 RepID=UPI00236621BE|nr:alpha/beta hydrolase-fold protein [Solibacillus daqui]
MNKSHRVFNSLHLNKAINYTVLTMCNDIKNAYIVYVQDGFDYLELGNLEQAMLHLVRDNPELAQHLVFVCIHPGDSFERWASFSSKGALFPHYIRFMNDEFIPTFEKSLQVEVILKRGLLGDSLAGNISLNIALDNPDRWTHLMLQSPAVSIEDIGRIGNLNLSGWHVYQTVGIYEDEFITPMSNEKLYILTRNRQLYKRFLLHSANVSYKETQDEHLWRVWENDLFNALRFFVM